MLRQHRSADVCRNGSFFTKGSDKKTLVSLMHANNEIGNIVDIKKIAQLCKEKTKDVVIVLVFENPISFKPY